LVGLGGDLDTGEIRAVVRSNADVTRVILLEAIARAAVGRDVALGCAERNVGRCHPGGIGTGVTVDMALAAALDAVEDPAVRVVDLAADLDLEVDRDLAAVVRDGRGRGRRDHPRVTADRHLLLLRGARVRIGTGGLAGRLRRRLVAGARPEPRDAA